MMKRIVLISFLCLLGSPFARMAGAQYIYMDSNGDGISSAADRLSAKGTTTLDIWVRTDQKRDGSKAVYSLNSQQPLTMFSYEITLHATGGTVKWGPYKNLVPSMDFEVRTESGPSDFYTGRFGGTALPPGKYKIGQIDVRVASGKPEISFASSGPFSRSARTSIGSQCAGKDGDHTLKLSGVSIGTRGARRETRGDWADADGVGAPAEVAVEMISGKEAPAAVSPNPLNPQGLITFSMRTAGAARVTVFDANGRLVATLLPRKELSAGPHSVRIEGKDSRGKRLASGVYFYSIERPEGEIRGRFVIAR
jgi:hypothetical protein